MELDEELLSRHASFVADGVEERALMLPRNDGYCFATAYLPPSALDTGFIVCHSYALELLTLRRTERALARTLARLGYPVIAPQRRGFGDSSGELEDATLDQQLDDVRAAWAHLQKETKTRKLGLIGARFGALIAGLLASDRAERLLLINPSLSGAGYFRALMREMHFVSLTSSNGATRRSMNDLVAALRSDGVLDVLGHPIYRHLYEALETVDLTTDIGAFHGDALVVQVSKRPAIARDVAALAGRIENAGGRVRIEHIKEPPGASFGGPAFVATSDPSSRENVQEPILETLSHLTEEWMTT